MYVHQKGSTKCSSGWTSQRNKIAVISNYFLIPSLRGIGFWHGKTAQMTGCPFTSALRDYITRSKHGGRYTYFQFYQAFPPYLPHSSKLGKFSCASQRAASLIYLCLYDGWRGYLSVLVFLLGLRCEQRPAALLIII